MLPAVEGEALDGALGITAGPKEGTCVGEEVRIRAEEVDNIEAGVDPADRGERGG